MIIAFYWRILFILKYSFFHEQQTLRVNGPLFQSIIRILFPHQLLYREITSIFLLFKLEINRTGIKRPLKLIIKNKLFHFENVTYLNHFNHFALTFLF